MCIIKDMILQPSFMTKDFMNEMRMDSYNRAGYKNTASYKFDGI